MQAIKFSLEVGINSDVLQGDSEMIIHALVDDNDFMKNLNPFGHLIKDAKFLVGDFRSIGFLQVCCQGNVEAHNLVEYVIHVIGYSVWMEDVPSYFTNIIQADMAIFS